MTDLLTVREASDFTGRSEGVLYKHLRKGKLKGQTYSDLDKQVVKIEKSELIRFFKLNQQNISNTGSDPISDIYQTHDKTINNKNIHEKTKEERSDTGSDPYQTHIRPNENLKEVLEQFFSEKETQLMKPIEQQALYRLGRMEQENEFLKQQVETLLQEIEKYKLLPGPVEEITEKLNHYEQQITELQQEKEKTASALQEEKQKLEDKLKTLPDEPEKINATLLQNAENMLLLKFQNEEIEKKYNEMEETLKAEEEEKQKLKDENKTISTILMQNADNINILQKDKDTINKQLQATEQSLTKKEEENLQLKADLEEFKKELELARRPWWKKLF